MNIDLKLLHHAVVLARHRHFGQAAAAMNISQPTLSRNIAALEKQLDLVTQLVITLSASLPAAQVPNWLAALTTMMSQSSATQFMGDDAAVSDIAATKAVIRKLQTTYFNLRQVTP